jgi:hypothetical protein
VADAVAPKRLWDGNGNRNQGVWSIIRELNDDVQAFCVRDATPLDVSGAASHPATMDGASDYFGGRTHAHLQVVHSWSGRPRPKCKNETRQSIRGNAQDKGQTPVVVGKGWLSHYPVAYAFRKAAWPGTDQVKVNNAWGPHDRTGADAIEWIWAQSWFSGEIYP